VISYFSKLQHLASYVSRHYAMAYDTPPTNEAIGHEIMQKKPNLRKEILPS
jgi:hypothetical protein